MWKSASACAVVMVAAGGAFAQGAVTWLGPFPDGGFGAVLAISPDGSTLTGRWYGPTTNNNIRAFRWRAGMAPLTGNLGGPRWEGFGADDSGLVIGYSELSPSAWHACTWNTSGAITDLGLIAGAPTSGYSDAMAVAYH